MDGFRDGILSPEDVFDGFAVKLAALPLQPCRKVHLEVGVAGSAPTW